MRTQRTLIEESRERKIETRIRKNPLTENIENLPPLSGVVQTTLKQRDGVELLATAALPDGREVPLLARAPRGQGMVAVWTTDLGDKWSSEFQKEDRFMLLLERVLRGHANAARE